MLKDGEKGVVLQRDRKTYAVAPHLPCGVVTAEMLRKIADVADKYQAAAIKCTGAQRIALVGIREEHVDAVWEELGCKPGQLTGRAVRSVRACPGTDFCKRGRQDALGVGLELDRRYHGLQLPGKMKLGVSGCSNQCSETAIKDIGLVGGAKGWTLLVGGMGGSCPMLGRPLLENEIDTPRALELIDAIMALFKNQAQNNERLGEMMLRMGQKEFLAALKLD